MEHPERPSVPYPTPPDLVLRRVSWLQRTVRYEWQSGGFLQRAPVFHATVQEWERAHD